MLLFLDWFLFLVHLALILVNLFGWLVPRARPWVLVCQLATWLSWLGLGLWYGLGYCPLTDWHWQVKAALGETELPRSLIKYYVDKAAGFDSPLLWIDVLAAAAFIAATLANCFLLWRDCRRRAALQAARG